VKKKKIGAWLRSRGGTCLQWVSFKRGLTFRPEVGSWPLTVRGGTGKLLQREGCNAATKVSLPEFRVQLRGIREMCRGGGRGGIRHIKQIGASADSEPGEPSVVSQDAKKGRFPDGSEHPDVQFLGPNLHFCRSGNSKLASTQNGAGSAQKTGRIRGSQQKR